MPSTPPDTFDENKNWQWRNIQDDVPVEADQCNIDSQIAWHNWRRLCCELIGNGTANNGFFIDCSGDPADPLIKAGNIHICGLKIELENDVLYSAQPNAGSAAAVTNPNDGLFYLEAEVVEIDALDDPDIINPVLGIECVKPHKIDWLVTWQMLQPLPVAGLDKYLLGLLSRTVGNSIDVRNDGQVDAHASTGYAGREGGRLGAGHGHWAEQIFGIGQTGPNSAAYNLLYLHDILTDLDTRIVAAAAGGRYIDQAGGTGGTYGVLTGLINGVNTDFTCSQGSYVSGKGLLSLDGQLLLPDGDDWTELNPAAGIIRLAVAPKTLSTLLYYYVKV